MDREILFHGKRLDNGEWVEGYLIRGARSYIAASNDVGYMVVSVSGMASVQLHAVDPSTVGQYTGLTDKNGKKIFEGDIVGAHLKTNRSKQIFRVIFRGGAFQLDNGHVVFGFVGVYSLNIIGSVHDNPELMGGEGDG